MKRTIADVIGNGENTEIYNTPNMKTTIYLNKRSEGFCDCCYKNFPPSELIYHSYTAGNGQTEYTIVSYLCGDCKG